MAQAVGPPRRNPAAVPAPRPAAEDSRAAPPAPRRVESPVFVPSSVRSGSTLLRVLLNSHSRVRAPHETHLRTARVQLSRPFTPKAVRALALDREELEHVVRDRVLHLEPGRSGKDPIVDKTPAGVHVRPRLRRCRPGARPIVLLRHPGAVVASLTARRATPDTDLPPRLRELARARGCRDRARPRGPGVSSRSLPCSRSGSARSGSSDRCP
ncbi:sulfotransferase [Streptomyces griseoviridis]|uniref:Sulfotransferase n=1 Tax=Streptomyces griseoviridis TaxID=45398 RepID=A0A918GFI2_STRGD|nr:sulfotransferase [Streptomyces niveoruber]GGS33414.1 hypothetical protein GCM10010238_23480 [Streptomyces niveoruber]